MQLVNSDQKFQRLFKAVDRDKNGSITIDELYTVLFPDKAEEEDLQVSDVLLTPPHIFQKRTERVEKHLEERRQSQAIQNVKTKTGALALFRGFSRGVEIDPISEDTEAKVMDRSDLRSPFADQKSKGSFTVGGKIVRLSKAATTGRISVPPKDLSIPSERPKIVLENKIPTPPKQPDKFTVLSEILSPRSSTFMELNPVNSATSDGYEAQSETELLSPQDDLGVLFQTKGRSKSAEAPPKPQILGPPRTSIVAMEPLTSIPSDSDIVSGFHENDSPQQPAPPSQSIKHWNVSDIEDEDEHDDKEDDDDDKDDDDEGE